MKFECPCSGCGLQYDTWLELVEHTQEHGAQTVPGDTSTQRTGNLTIHTLIFKGILTLMIFKGGI